MKGCTRWVKERQEHPHMAIRIIKANPDLEVVKTDDKAGEITIRDKKSAK